MLLVCMAGRTRLCFSLPVGTATAPEHLGNVDAVQTVCWAVFTDHALRTRAGLGRIADAGGSTRLSDRCAYLVRYI